MTQKPVPLADIQDAAKYRNRQGIWFSPLVSKHLRGKPNAWFFRGEILFELHEPLTVVLPIVGDTPYVITVPVGFVSNGASVPWYLQWRFRCDGPWAEAAWVHDYLYAVGQCDKPLADMIFFVLMLALGVRHEDAMLMYLAVRYSKAARKAWAKGRHK